MPWTGAVVAFLPVLALGILTPQVGAAQDAAGDRRGVLTGDSLFAGELFKALQLGNLEDALRTLEARPEIAWSAPGVRLRAELLVRTGRSREALNLLEAHLAQDGGDAIARFQVAEVHFAAGGDHSAVLAYRLALAGQLDPVRRDIARGRLIVLDARRRTRFSASFSVSPDTNLNNATNASTIDLYGLPFTLSDDARRRSGVAAAIGLGVERRQPLSDRFALLAGGGVAVLDAPNSTFDQTSGSIFVGTEIHVAEHARVNLTVSYRDVDFGGADLETAWGGQLTAQAFSDAQTRWDGGVRIDRIDNQHAEELDGVSTGLHLARTRFLGPSALWRSSLTFDAHDLNGSEASYDQARVAVGRLFPLPLAGLVYVEPYGRLRDFEQRSSVFGVRRRDREIGLSFRVSKRDWSLNNAFPYVQVLLSRGSSNVELGRYSRQRVEFGLTRDF